MNLPNLRESLAEHKPDCFECNPLTGQRTEAPKAVCSLFNEVVRLALFAVTNVGTAVVQHVTTARFENIDFGVLYFDIIPGKVASRNCRTAKGSICVQFFSGIEIVPKVNV